MQARVEKCRSVVVGNSLKIWVTGTTNVTTGAIVQTYRYKPYGAKLSGGSIGAGFFWTGNTGSRSTGKAFAEQYNRARHYSSTTRQWITRDPLWPDEHAYGYVHGKPVTIVDPNGWQAVPALSGPVLTLEPGGAGAGAGVGLAGACTLVFGAEACYEMCTYEVDKPTGIFTWLADYCGRKLGEYLYPLPGDLGQVITIRKVECAGKRRGRPENPGYGPIPSWEHITNKLGPNPLCPKCPDPYMLCEGDSNSHHYFKGMGCCLGEHCHYHVYNQSPDCTCYDQKTDKGFCKGILIPWLKGDACR